MKLSVVISSLWIDNEKPSILHKCVSSLSGHNELLALVTDSKTPLGFADSWNRVARLATGDYILFVGDNCVLDKGDLKDLCIENTVSSPVLNFQTQNFWGSVFCMPRNVYEQVGLYDMRYNEGSNYEDDDLRNRIEKIGYKFRCVVTVQFSKPSGGRTIDANPDKELKKRRNAEIYREIWS